MDEPPTWRTIDSALSPIVGERGVQMLFQRSVHLTVGRFPWLAPLREAGVRVADVGRLEAALAPPSGAEAEAEAAKEALLRALYDLLASLIGAPLTERLLPAVAAQLSGAPAAPQDTVP